MNPLAVKRSIHYETGPDRIFGLVAESLEPIKRIPASSANQNLYFVDHSTFDLNIKAKLIWDSCSIL